MLLSLLLNHLRFRPRVFLLMTMFVSMIMSAVVSNVAAHVLMLGVLNPIFREHEAPRRYLKAVLLGLAFSCNIGGMLSPIASPQNIIASGYLSHLQDAEHVSFLTWFAIACPLCLLWVIVS